MPPHLTGSQWKLPAQCGTSVTISALTVESAELLAIARAASKSGATVTITHSELLPLPGRQQIEEAAKGQITFA